MWLISTGVFWASAGLLAYTYVGYPLAMRIRARMRPRPFKRAPITPRVTVVMAARNEASNLATKLENLLTIDYPADKLDIIVVSDGSTDATCDVVESFRSKGVRLARLETSSGKARALNVGVAQAEGELILFCDVRQRVDPTALRKVVEAFADPQIGAVSGELHINSERGPGIYWKYEKSIREAESRVDSVVGATGAFFVIRRELFRQLPDQTLLDDVYTPMQIAMQGFRVLFEPEAKVYDREADLRGEFSRKARTLAGNFQLLRQMPELLSYRKNPVFFQYVSHKVLRLICPIALGTLFASNVVLVCTFAPGWPLYVATLGGQLACYGLALWGEIRGPKAGRAARVSHTFVVLNAAAVEGFRRFLKGDLGWTTLKETGPVAV
jgi:cellulose synthase/poly-beta-1,6-N-acetylglucosamine synthase-like glycosyltransferase